MANRLVFIIAAVAVFTLCCNAAHLTHEQHKEHAKEAMERHWNNTVTKWVAVGSKLADKVEDALNRTAVRVMDTAQKIGGIKEGLVTNVAAVIAQGSNMWSELRNKSSEKMARTQTKMDAAKQKMHDKLAAGAENLVEKGNKLVNFTVGVVGKVVSKLVEKFQQARSKFQEHKAEHNARISVVPLNSKMSTLSARIITSAKSVTPVAEVSVKEESTTKSSSPQPTYSY
ncbi:uncharacterized protein LOC130702532 [Daphnia carinata]|uniref:uncharacterized protein LOC130702532 n=1 Tax=Daphnia carinata TaxID=120202 RepID=UPI00257BE7B2|nr:uncharacterized protein LOC130702532 [Daphnia carinata]